MNKQLYQEQALPAPPIGVIAPTVEIMERTREVARELDMLDAVSLHTANLGEGLALARKLEAEGVHVFVARRGMVELIKKELASPVAPIPVTMQDMARTLAKAKNLTGIEQPRIALFTFPSGQADLEVFAELMGINLMIYTMIADEKYMDWLVEQAIMDQAHVIVGGSVVTLQARRRNFPAIFLDSGPLALRTALLEADKLAYARRLEKTLAERFRVVVETSKDGIVVVDGDGVIQVSNPAACAVLRCAPDVSGRAVWDFLPLPSVKSAFSHGRSLRDTIVTVGGLTLLLTMEPTTVNGEMRGAVLTVKPAESVSELGTKISRSLFSAGFASKYTFADIEGASPQIREAAATAERYALAGSPVLLYGETGTGKELFAHAIHHAGAFRRGPFVPVNCASMPPTLLESELFGYDEGAFTGASRRGKVGLLEMAHGGTVFLDEVSELDHYAQLRLLRVLQERSVLRIGGNRFISLDFRVIAASNRYLPDLVDQGQFRADLYYRLASLCLDLPPLRAREGDVAFLVGRFMARESPVRGLHLSAEAVRELEGHFWPGNVRELQNVARRLCVAAGAEGCRRADAAAVRAALLRRDGNAAGSATAGSPGTRPAFFSGTALLGEEGRIREALRRCEGHQGRAAALLGMDRNTLYRKMKKHGITRFQ